MRLVPAVRGNVAAGRKGGKVLRRKVDSNRAMQSPSTDEHGPSTRGGRFQYVLLTAAGALLAACGGGSSGGGGGNRLPVATPTGPFVTNEDTPSGPITLTGTDVEDAEANLQVNVTAMPANGWLDFTAGAAPMQVVYTPDPDFDAADSFSFTVTDTDGGVSTAVTVDLNVTGQNDPPSFTPIGTQVAVVGTPFSFVPPATDPDTGAVLPPHEREARRRTLAGVRSRIEAGELSWPEAVRRYCAPRGEGGEPGVWAIHAVSPSTYDEDRFKRLVDGLLECNIGIISCPSAAIGMRQLRPLKTPTGNCIPRILELLAAGVRVRLGSDNVADICSPSTTADLTDEVFVLSAAIRYYQIDVLARIAAGQDLDESERSAVIGHLRKNDEEIEQVLRATGQSAAR